MGLSLFVQELMAFLQGLVHRNSSGNTGRIVRIAYVEKRACPKCRQIDEVARVRYGYPNMKALAESEEDYALGGCLFDPDDPQLACKRCGVRFGFPNPEESPLWIDGRGVVEPREQPGS